MRLVYTDGASYWHYIAANTGELNMNVRLCCNDTFVKTRRSENILSLYSLCTINSTRNSMEPISLLLSEKLAIKHLSSGVHFIGVAVYSLCVLKYFC